MEATLLNLMDGISRTDGMLDSIDPALRRPARLGRETEIGNTNRLPGKLKLWDTLVCFSARLAVRFNLFLGKIQIFFFFAKIKCCLYFLDRFDVLISKMIFIK